eukprot:TRINITY_DN48515_c0_g1_i1.p1 TRINITY_DN48515_c0_g1~~TRINITY_DN48515_c0_g1_i1.p1  ORF type:complete len:285 (-),score=23.07 TRINITY_DN48515_c0_g1_i1:65-919(-)
MHVYIQQQRCSMASVSISGVSVRPYRPEDHSKVSHLFASGLSSNADLLSGSPYADHIPDFRAGIEGYASMHLSDDLHPDRLPSAYMTDADVDSPGAAGFWVAELPSDSLAADSTGVSSSVEVVGTVAMSPINSTSGAASQAAQAVAAGRIRVPALGNDDPPGTSHDAKGPEADGPSARLPTCELLRMSVDPRARRRGVGRALLEWWEAVAWARGFRVALLETLSIFPAVRLYESAGYVQVHSTQLETFPTDMVTVVTLAKALRPPSRPIAHAAAGTACSADRSP